MQNEERALRGHVLILHSSFIVRHSGLVDHPALRRGRFVRRTSRPKSLSKLWAGMDAYRLNGSLGCFFVAITPKRPSRWCEVGFATVSFMCLKSDVSRL